jgi:hypothetical protein
VPMKARLLCTLALLAGTAQGASVSTILGTGIGGYSGTEVNNPYGMAMGPDGGLYFCDLGNQRVRRLDLKTKRVTLIAGNGKAGYSGDSGPATEALSSRPPRAGDMENSHQFACVDALDTRPMAVHPSSSNRFVQQAVRFLT